MQKEVLAPPLPALALPATPQSCLGVTVISSLIPLWGLSNVPPEEQGLVPPRYQVVIYPEEEGLEATCPKTQGEGCGDKFGSVRETEPPICVSDVEA